MTADVVTADRVDRINRALDEQKRVLDTLATKAQRPPLEAAAPRSPAASLQHKQAFDGYVRSGDTTRLRGLEQKALSVGSDPDGGYLVPDEVERAVNHALRTISPIRAIAGIRQVSGSVYKKPFALTGADTGWVAETAARSPTNAPRSPSSPPHHGAVRHARGHLRAPRRQRRQHRTVDRRGSARRLRPAGRQCVRQRQWHRQAEGFPRHHHCRQRRVDLGNLGVLKTGVDGGFAAANPGDKLIDLVYAVKAGYRANGTFVFNRATQAAIRKMRDAAGDYIWQPAARAGEASTLMGFPVAESEDMPNIATAASPLPS